MLRNRRRDDAGILEDYLDREMAFALTGDIDGLNRILHEKVRLTEMFTSLKIDAVPLERIRRKAERNQVLLESCSRGIKNVSARLQQVRDVKRELRTYTSEGQNQTLGKSDSSFERRA